MSNPNPNIRAVPNPPESSETKDLIKTVVITSAVSTLVGVFATAGGTALYRLIKRAVKGKDETPKQQPAQPRPQVSNSAWSEFDDMDEMPESLRMNPRLRNTGGRRRRRNSGGDRDELARMLAEFDSRWTERFDRMEKRITELSDDEYEDEDEDEYEDDAA